MSKIIRAGDNIYAELGIPDADVHKVKASLVIKIAKILAAEGMSQTAAAKRIGVSQPEVSKLLSGHFRTYSIEKLLQMLLRLGRDVDIKVSKRPAKEREGKVTVAA